MYISVVTGCYTLKDPVVKGGTQAQNTLAVTCAGNFNLCSTVITFVFQVHRLGFHQSTNSAILIWNLILAMLRSIQVQRLVL